MLTRDTSNPLCSRRWKTLSQQWVEATKLHATIHSRRIRSRLESRIQDLQSEMAALGTSSVSLAAE